MGCTRAELYRLMDLIYLKVFEEDLKPKSVEGAKAKLLRVPNDVKGWSMDELRSRHGL